MLGPFWETEKLDIPCLLTLLYLAQCHLQMSKLRFRGVRLNVLVRTPVILNDWNHTQIALSEKKKLCWLLLLERMISDTSASMCSVSSGVCCSVPLSSAFLSVGIIYSGLFPPVWPAGQFISSSRLTHSSSLSQSLTQKEGCLSQQSDHVPGWSCIGLTRSRCHCICHWTKSWCPRLWKM